MQLALDPRAPSDIAKREKAVLEAARRIEKLHGSTKLLAVEIESSHKQICEKLSQVQLVKTDIDRILQENTLCYP